MASKLGKWGDKSRVAALAKPPQNTVKPTPLQSLAKPKNAPSLAKTGPAPDALWKPNCLDCGAAANSNTKVGKNIYLKPENVMPNGRLQKTVKKLKAHCKDSVPCEGLKEAEEDLKFAALALRDLEDHHITISKARANPERFPEGPGCPDNALASLKRSLRKKYGEHGVAAHWQEECYKRKLGYPNGKCPDAPDMKDNQIDIMGCHDISEKAEFPQRFKRGETCLKSRIRALAALKPHSEYGEDLIQSHLPPLQLAYELAKCCAIAKGDTLEKINAWDKEIANLAKQVSRVGNPELGFRIRVALREAWQEHKAMKLDPVTGLFTKPTCREYNPVKKECRPNSNKSKGGRKTRKHKRV